MVSGRKKHEILFLRRFLFKLNQGKRISSHRTAGAERKFIEKENNINLAKYKEIQLFFCITDRQPNRLCELIAFSDANLLSFLHMKTQQTRLIKIKLIAKHGMPVRD